MAKVYYTKGLDTSSMRNLFGKILDEQPLKQKKAAVKVHFGEDGNTRYMHPSYIKELVSYLKEKGIDSFLTDTNTLYRGKRTNATDHKALAKEHGFDFAPIVIGDGERGDEEVNIVVEQKHFREVKLGKVIQDFSELVVISHFKGHILFGFGGALKNLGMGFGSRAGKLAMHSKIRPSISDKCNACGVCKENCDVDAIIIDEKAHITDACVGCAKCISVCPVGAVSIPWGGATSDQAQERCAEYALGATKDKKALYITLINNVTKDCDCLSDSRVIGHDIGILASTDPVAIDQAAYDLLLEKEGMDVFQEAGNPDGTHIIDYAEKIGVGSSEYELVEIKEG